MSEHEHDWKVTETGTCNDGHALRVSECPCGAWKQEWPETEEYIEAAEGTVRCLINHHIAALFVFARQGVLGALLAKALAGLKPPKDPALN